MIELNFYSTKEKQTQDQTRKNKSKDNVGDTILGQLPQAWPLAKGSAHTI
jgi:hypothetical protein